MLNRSLIFGAIFLMGMAITPSYAGDWRSAGGWEITEVDSETCGMGLKYEGEGETLLLLGLSIDGSVFISLTNYRWSATPDKAYDLIYLLNGTAYQGGDSVGVKNGIRKGFATRFEPNFLEHFAASTYLTVKSKEGVTVDDLKLDGSAAGLVQLRRCVARLKAVAAAAAREKARLAHIPADPFAKVEGRSLIASDGGTVKTAPQSITGVLQGLVRPSDYPSSALDNREEGTVDFVLTIGLDGRVTGCTVSSSSGSRTLDSATCRLMTTRARFTPARTFLGHPTTGTFKGTVSWRL